MKKIKQNGYTIGNYMIKGLTFFSIPIFARLLSPDNYGIYNTYIAYESILCMCVGFTLNTCQKNARYKYGKDYGEFVSSCMILLLVSAGTWLLLIKMFEGPLTTYTGFDYWIHNLLILHCLGSAILSIFNVYLSITYSYKGYLLAAGFNAVFNIGLSILLIKTVFSWHPAKGRIVGTVIPVLFLAVFICLYFWKEKRPPADRTTNFRYWRFALAYSVPLIPHGISQVLLNQFDRIMINSICGAAQAGIYSFAYNIYSIVGVTTASLENVWSPIFFHGIPCQRFTVTAFPKKLFPFEERSLSPCPTTTTPASEIICFASAVFISHTLILLLSLDVSTPLFAIQISLISG